MPDIKQYLHTVDLVNNKITNLLLNPLTTAQRTTVGGTLGVSDQGYVCYDVDLDQQFFWDGTTWVTGLAVPNLQQVTTAGNITTNSIEVSFLQTNGDVNVGQNGAGGALNVNDGNLVSARVQASNITTLNRVLDLPDNNGVLALSVNGVAAAADGSITIPVGTGTVTAVTATSPITSSGGTAPNISTSMNTNKLIGRSTAGVGVMEEITVGTGLSLSGGTLSSSVTGGIPHATASGTDTYTATVTGVTSYTDGDAYIIQFTNGNTTGCTLNINGLGAIPLYRNNDGALIGGDIQASGEMLCVYDATVPAFRTIGTSPNTIIAYVTNDDSVTITKGQPVYAFSGTGDRMTVKLANNTSDATSAQTVGLVMSTSIAANQKGFIMLQGLLDGLSNVKPVNGWADGSAVYLGATAGAITPTKPYAPNHLVYLGFVTTASPGSAGRVYVRVQNGYELDELHNVQAQTPTYKDTLWYDNTVSPAQWKTASISTILGYTPFQLPSLTAGSVLFSNGTTIAQDNSNFFWDNTNKRLGIGTNSPSYPLHINSSVTASANSAIGSQISPTLIASANNDILTALNVNPTFTNGAFTGVSNYAAIFNGNIQFYTASTVKFQVNPLTNRDFGADLGSGVYFRNGSSTGTVGLLAGTGTDGTNRILVNADGSTWILGTTVIGGSTNAGYKLDVVGGNTRLGTTTSNTLTIGNGMLFDYSSSRSRIYSNNSIIFTSALTTGSKIITGVIGGNSNTTGSVEFESALGDISQTSGTYIDLSLSGRLLHTSGTSTYNFLSVSPTLQTSIGGTYTGTVRGFYYNPTTVNAFGGTQIAFENTTGDIVHGNLSGVGTRMVTADATGKLGVQAIPSGGTPAGSTGYVQFNTSGAFNGDANLFWDNTNKRLGIGTSSPTYGLDVNGTARAVTSFETPQINGNTTASGSLTLSSTTNATKGKIFFGSNSAYDEVNDRLGIGYTNPSQKFMVNGNVSISGTYISGGYGIGQRMALGADNTYRTTNAGASVTPTVSIVPNGGISGSNGLMIDPLNSTGIIFTACNSGAVNQIARAGINIASLTNTAGAESGDLTFLTQSGGTAMSEKMRIFAGGNVAIGTTTNAGYKLDVNGTSNFGNTATFQNAAISTAGVSSSSQIQVAGGVFTTTTFYKLTNAGANVTPRGLFGGGNSAGVTCFGMDENNGITLIGANNANNRIARAGINITNLVNTTASESADMIFLTQSGGTAMSEKMRITSVGAIAFNGAANTGTSGQVLTSAGSGAPPTWTTVSGGGVTTGDAIAYAIALG